MGRFIFNVSHSLVFIGVVEVSHGGTLWGCGDTLGHFVGRLFFALLLGMGHMDAILSAKGAGAGEASCCALQVALKSVVQLVYFVGAFLAAWRLPGEHLVRF